MRALTIHLILYWGYLWGVFFMAGFAGLRVLHRLVPRAMTSYRVGDITWFGIAAVTWGGLCASLVTHLAGGFHAAVLGSLIVYGVGDRRGLAAYAAAQLEIYGRHGRSLRWRIPFFGVLTTAVIILVALSANGDPTCYDTLLYHAQSVRWLKEHGTVPGLANLNSRIGFNNAWFVTAAFADVGPFTFKSFHAIDSFLYVFMLITLTARFVNTIGAPFLLSRLFDALMLYPLLRYRSTINSLSTDVAASLAAIYIASYFLRHHETDEAQGRDLGWACVVVPFAVTVKLINLPLLLLPVVSFLATVPRGGTRWFTGLGRPLRQACGYGAIVMVVFSPWLMRNVVLSGFVLYPCPSLDLFSPDWKIDRDIAVREAQWVTSWARAPGALPATVLGKGFEPWFAGWLELSIPELREFLYWIVTGLIAAALFLRSLREQLSRVWPVLLTLAVALLYWFVQAPSVRYAYGYLTATEILIVSGLLRIGTDAVSEKGRLMLATVFAASLAIYLHAEIGEGFRTQGFFLNRALTEYPRAQLQPYAYPSGLTISVPITGDACINEPALCSPGTECGKFVLSLRHGTIESGFRIRER